MIQVGINENIILKNVELTEKDGKYAIDFTLAEAGDTEEYDPLNEAYDENGMLITGGKGGLVVKVWPLNVPKDDTFDGRTKTVKEKIDESNEASKEMQNLFTAFARCYVTSDKIHFERFKNIPITKETMSMLLDENVLINITKNLTSQFLEVCSSYLGKQETPLRILLRRQSATKHYPAFRDRLIQAFPFVELMAVPKEASKIGFTKYEIQKGLNSGVPSVDTDVPAEAAAPVDPSTLFGQPAADLSQDSTLN
jgi:hypothetical protein